MFFLQKGGGVSLLEQKNPEGGCAKKRGWGVVKGGTRIKKTPKRAAAEGSQEHPCFRKRRAVKVL